VNLDTTSRIAVGSLLLGLVGVAALLALGYTHLALPALGGVVWGVVNIVLLKRVIRYVRPDGAPNVGRLILDVGVKFPLMYAVAFVLLRPRPLDEIVAAAAGFTLVLVVMLLRALGWLLTHTGDRSDRRSVA
jgi:hypothetical protein